MGHVWVLWGSCGGHGATLDESMTCTSDSTPGGSAAGDPDESKAEDEDEEYEIAEEIEEVVERLLTVRVMQSLLASGRHDLDLDLHDFDLDLHDQDRDVYYRTILSPRHCATRIRSSAGPWPRAWDG